MAKSKDDFNVVTPGDDPNDGVFPNVTVNTAKTVKPWNPVSEFPTAPGEYEVKRGEQVETQLFIISPQYFGWRGQAPDAWREKG